MAQQMTLLSLVFGGGATHSGKKHKKSSAKSKHRFGGHQSQYSGSAENSTMLQPLIDTVSMNLRVIDFSELESYSEDPFAMGATATVSTATLDGSQVAVKSFLFGELTFEVISEFLRESLLISDIRHRNVVRLLGACLRPPELCLVYEHALCGDLSALLLTDYQNPYFKHKQSSENERELRAKARMLGTRLSVLTDVARGMTAIHDRRLIHRDLKTANVLVQFDASSRFQLVAKVCDFGSARRIDPTFMLPTPVPTPDFKPVSKRPTTSLVKRHSSRLTPVLKGVGSMEVIKSDKAMDVSMDGFGCDSRGQTPEAVIGTTAVGEDLSKRKRKTRTESFTPVAILRKMLTSGSSKRMMSSKEDSLSLSTRSTEDSEITKTSTDSFASSLAIASKLFTETKTQKKKKKSAALSTVLSPKTSLAIAGRGTASGFFRHVHESVFQKDPKLEKIDVTREREKLARKDQKLREDRLRQIGLLPMASVSSASGGGTPTFLPRTKSVFSSSLKKQRVKWRTKSDVTTDYTHEVLRRKRKKKGQSVHWKADETVAAQPPVGADGKAGWLLGVEETHEQVEDLQPPFGKASWLLGVEHTADGSSASSGPRDSARSMSMFEVELSADRSSFDTMKLRKADSTDSSASAAMSTSTRMSSVGTHSQSMGALRDLELETVNSTSQSLPLPMRNPETGYSSRSGVFAVGREDVVTAKGTGAVVDKDATAVTTVSSSGSAVLDDDEEMDIVGLSERSLLGNLPEDEEADGGEDEVHAFITKMMKESTSGSDPVFYDGRVLKQRDRAGADFKRVTNGSSSDALVASGRGTVVVKRSSSKLLSAAIAKDEYYSSSSPPLENDLDLDLLDSSGSSEVVKLKHGSDFKPKRKLKRRPFAGGIGGIGGGKKGKSSKLDVFARKVMHTRNTSTRTDPRAVMTTQVGTLAFMAPEILSHLDYASMGWKWGDMRLSSASVLSSRSSVASMRRSLLPVTKEGEEFGDDEIVKMPTVVGRSTHSKSAFSVDSSGVRMLDNDVRGFHFEEEEKAGSGGLVGSLLRKLNPLGIGNLKISSRLRGDTTESISPPPFGPRLSGARNSSEMSLSRTRPSTSFTQYISDRLSTVSTASRSQRSASKVMLETKASKTNSSVFQTMKYAMDPSVRFEYSLGIDVYSFAVIMWEVCNLKHVYDNMQASDIARYVLRGHRLDTLTDGGLTLAPLGVRELLEDLIADCWAHDPRKRPKFHAIRDRLEHMQLLLDGPVPGGTHVSGGSSGFDFSLL